MTRLVWKRKNNWITISPNQLKGIVAVCLILVIIPFFHLFYLSRLSYEAPDYTEQFIGAMAVEIIQEEQRGEIYFLKPGTSAGEFFQIAGLGKLNTQDFILSEGMSIIVDKNDSGTNVVVSEMNAAQRLALGMPLDINEASRDDLILVEGIGEATAEKIIELREKLGRFKNIEQLKLIKGIKEKRLSGLRKYLYVRRS